MLLASLLAFFGLLLCFEEASSKVIQQFLFLVCFLFDIFGQLLDTLRHRINFFLFRLWVWSSGLLKLQWLAIFSSEEHFVALIIVTIDLFVVWVFRFELFVGLVSREKVSIVAI